MDTKSPNDPLLLIGVRLIDLEHEALIEGLDRLIHSPDSTAYPEHVSEAIGRLMMQMIDHFQNEEALMKSLSMPPDELARHIDAHGEILQEMTKMCFDLVGYNIPDTAALGETVKPWIVDHLLEYDVRIAQYVAE